MSTTRILIGVGALLAGACSAAGSSAGGGAGGAALAGESGGASGKGSGGSVASAGFTANGGSLASSGGSSNGGAANGGAALSGGAAGSGGSLASAGSSAMGGSTSVGGAVATGGAAATSGGTTAVAGSSGIGGTSASGGSTSVTACPGIPITPDAMGHVALSSNTLGINGNWFYYSDCVDLKNMGCSSVTAPTTTTSFPNTGGKMCTSGSTGTSASAWGAGLGFELNDAGGQQPYNATSHGVTGICFVLSGTKIPPSTGIRVAFTTKNNNDNAYFKAVSNVGQNTVLFSDLSQASWQTKEVWDPTTIILLQFQIPAAPPAAVPWDFCIEGLTAITQ